MIDGQEGPSKPAGDVVQQDNLVNTALDRSDEAKETAGTAYRMSLVSLLIAICSAGAAWYQNYVANESLTIAKNEFNDKRALVLRLEKTSEGAFAVVPLDSRFQVINLRLIYPQTIDARSARSPFRPTDGALDLPVEAVRGYVKQTFPARDDAIQVGRLDLPVVAESDYIAEGRRISDRSLYRLELDFGIPATCQDIWHDPEVKRLVLVGSLAPDDDIQKRLARELASTVPEEPVTLYWPCSTRARKDGTRAATK